MLPCKNLAFNLGFAICILVANVAAAGPDTPGDPAEYEKKIAPLLKKYCYECHGEKKPRAGVSFTNVDVETIATKQRKNWAKTLEMVEFGAMPPDDRPQLSEQEKKLLIEWLESQLYFVDCNKGIDPGRLTVQRLNRNEYNNTIRDLFGVDLKPAEQFPSDDVGNGFDNIGDVLSLSPLLFEKYVAAAESVAEQLIVVPPSSQLLRKRGRELEGIGSANLARYETYHLYSTGSVIGRFKVPAAGRYTVRVEAGADQAGSERAKMEVHIGSNKVRTFEVTSSAERMRKYEFTFDLPAGNRRLMASFVNDYYNPKAKNPKQRDRNLYIRTIELEGPQAAQPDNLPDAHKRIVARRPQQGLRDLRPAAKANLKPIIQRAFRRPVSEDELMRYVGLVELAAKKGDNFERGMQVAITGILVSPSFLFRFELDDDPNDPARIRDLTDWELATRLSYFLWSSMPDDELFRLAGQGKLKDPSVLRQQVARMLKDAKSKALVENFGGQWLNLRNLDEVTPDPTRFPGFDTSLRNAMRQETLLFFEHIMRNDRSIVEFLTAPYTFVNQRLARHYGMPRVRGDEFRQVPLDGAPRRGVLMQASILTITSNPDRTSPVKRGKWIMDNILGSPPPEPPANVPELEETRKASPNASLRKQLEIHRADPNCATCHKKMDAIGFGFENFDAIGRWREKENGQTVDASGVLPEGSKFSGPLQLVQVLQQEKEDFAKALTRKMLTYALGRGLEYYDRCVVDKIVKEVKANEYRFAELITQVVLSDSFRKRRGEGKAE